MDVAIPAQTIYSLSSGIGGPDESVRLVAPGSKTLCYVEREAFNCECERHDLLLARCKAMTFASPLRTFIKAIECAAVFYAVAVVASCTGEAKT